MFTCESFATADECEALIAAAERVLQSYNRSWRNPRERLPIATKLDHTLLLRLFTLIELQLPALCEAKFGQKAELQRMSRRFSPAEPAVNIYTVGGEFAPHTDKEHLTLLSALHSPRPPFTICQLSPAPHLLLSVPLDPPGAFEGGGTAFWSASHHPPCCEGYVGSMAEENDRERWLPHDYVIRAPRGTAIIFGGDVTHAGLPVVAGKRHLFVMSFSLQKRQVQAELPPVAVHAVVPDGDEAIGEEADHEALDDFMDAFS